MSLDLDTTTHLDHVITRQRPFGPPDASQFTGDVELLRLLYDPANRIHRQAASTGAPFVIGRKGAGKTALVTAPKLRPEVVAVEMPSADVYQGVFMTVDRLLALVPRIFPEHAARIWRHLTWSVVLAAVARRTRSRSKASRIVREFSEALGDGKVPADPEAAVSGYLRRLRSVIAATTDVGGVGELLSSVKGNGWTISEAIDAGTALLAKDGETRYVVVVDSLEKYDGHLPVGDYLPPADRVSLEGLFRFVGGDGTTPGRSFDIRFAFPAELWPVLQKVSVGTIKDFHSRVIVHWSARELITLIGNRLAIYCLLHHPDVLSSLGLDDRRPTPIGYQECRRLLDEVLPRTVVNAQGDVESTIAYLTRHTQLLPRHLIRILNSAFQAQERVDPRAPFPIAQLAVLEGVREGEVEIVRDILAAYRPVHPLAELCCERILPNVGPTADRGELHRAYVQGGIKAQGIDFRETLQVLTEIGCLGRVVESDSTSRYVVGEFEYTRTGSLHIGDDEQRCMHPVFAGVYGNHASTGRRRRQATGDRAVTPVYPFGSDPDEAEDYRDLS